MILLFLIDLFFNQRKLIKKLTPESFYSPLRRSFCFLSLYNNKTFATNSSRSIQPLKLTKFLVNNNFNCFMEKFLISSASFISSNVIFADVVDDVDDDDLVACPLVDLLLSLLIVSLEFWFVSFDDSDVVEVLVALGDECVDDNGGHADDVVDVDVDDWFDCCCCCWLLLVEAKELVKEWRRWADVVVSLNEEFLPVDPVDDDDDVVPPLRIRMTKSTSSDFSYVFFNQTLVRKQKKLKTKKNLHNNDVKVYFVKQETILDHELLMNLILLLK